VTRFEVVRRRASAARFHARPIPDPARPELWIHEVAQQALVLGSTQDDSVVDGDACRAAGVEVVRRRSGGGAVLLVPGEVVWVDLILPAGAPGWSDDVHRPMVWFGERLANAFESLGVATAVHGGAMRSTAWSRLMCFDGLGAGELTVDGAKLVGISQRRTRAAARLQACWYTRYDASRFLDLVSVEVDASVLSPVATVAADVAAAVPDALAAALADAPAAN
jgi:lipoate-protein ligase A